MSPTRKHYKLYLCDDYRKERVSKWTRRRYQKILLSAEENIKLTNYIRKEEHVEQSTNNCQELVEQSTSDCHQIVDHSTSNIQEIGNNIQEAVDNNVQHLQDFDTEIKNKNYDISSSDSDIVYNDDSYISSNVSSETSIVYIEDECKNNDIYSSTDSESDEGSSNDDDMSSNPDKNSYNFQQDNRIMFPSSNLTVWEVLLMLKGIIIKYNITRDLQAALVQLIQSLAGPEFHNCKDTPYFMSKMIETPTDKIKKHYYCNDCNEKLLTVEGVVSVSKQVQCDKCEEITTISSKSLNYFMTVDIQYQLQLLLNRPDIQQNMESLKKIPRNTDVIQDIYDCESYKNIQKHYPDCLTFNFNGDGAQLFNSAKKSLWPLQLYINELTPDIRFKHIILAALLQTEKEPTAVFMNLYMDTFMKECEILRTKGVDIRDHRTRKIVNKKVLPLFGCTDSVARPLFQNRIKFNGSYGCSYCYHPEKYDSGCMRYPLLEKDPEERCHTDHLKDKYKASELKTWLIFISLPCLHGILPKELFDSYALFASSIYVLLKKSITNSDIANCELQLMRFVGESQIFYGIKFITFNVHCLIHYCLAVRRTGPLACASAFPFENGIYKFLREINAPNGCIKQIVNKWLKRAEFQNYLENETVVSPAIDFCKALFIDKQLLKNVTVIGKATLIGSGFHNLEVENYFRNFRTDETSVMKVYDRCIYESKFIHTVKYNRVKKTNDSVIQTVSGQIIEIHYFVSLENVCYEFGKILVIGSNNFHGQNETAIAPHIYRITEKKTRYSICNITEIAQKAIIINSDKQTYLSIIPNDFEVQ